ncbi:hypothetical protein NEUTE1DRAFT_84109 [Neurospora tetrasperma FGSC 2508]|uniref:UmuC domain-containing protein n=1 Tax=Neurospora tetrasperma (strain FGSC 2508 / ATCC MYA-4615 / P0657) TaxID=510951 RepID=F8MQP2_NEUT8|nr:uncharacterized protein NEUTE1DRAFT_84109 [Neurospora tetrasperma FGSC 2508]EGO56672.1 hypothetical protein NEUTE1DRAFT_84109 [Neurospora tetrasperma FGSC 2508]EGZ70453.1 DNA/RNA polymerase [Neurospora tetrasperma FGSC 2509]
MTSGAQRLAFHSLHSLQLSHPVSTHCNLQNGAKTQDHQPQLNTTFRNTNSRCIHIVYENKTPSLKSLPLGIRQKSLLATCNYPARRLGVKKLMSIASALAICPDLVIVDGEDLTPFRDVSKRLYALLRSYSWNDRVERLGLDEVWMDHSWFCLDNKDPEKGFAFNARGFAGQVYGREKVGLEGSGTGGYGGGQAGLLRTKLLLASHLALHLRLKIEEEGYTTACGISTNKLLAKLVGNVNKPRNQTTLLSFGPDDGEETIQRFMGSHQLRKVPGIGGKTAAALSDYFISQSKPGSSSPPNPKEITVDDLLSCPNLSPSKLDSLLSSLSFSSGTGTGIGKHIVSLLHGHDSSPVKPARLLPTQISIEDTYFSCPLVTIEQIQRELVKITGSLLKRMKTDLMDDDKKRWLARPKTLRLTTRPRTDPREGRGYGYGRVSKSQGLPGYVFTIAGSNSHGNAHGDDEIIQRLVAETLLPMFRELNPLNPRKGEKGYSIGLLNVCVTNMDSVDPTTGGGGSGGRGRDIKNMFMRAREFTVYDPEHEHADNTGIQPETEAEPLDNLDAEDLSQDPDLNLDMSDTSYESSIGKARGSAEDNNNDNGDPSTTNHQQQHPVSNIHEQAQAQADRDTNHLGPIMSTNHYYFHIEDDDEVWDDSPDNVWNHDEEEEAAEEEEATEEDLDYDDLRDAEGLGVNGDSDGGDGIKCPLCNHFIPLFALSAHERFHSMEFEGELDA